MKNTRATGLAVMAAYISCNVCVLADGFEEAALKRGSSLMRLSKPKVRAEMETIQNALDKELPWSVFSLGVGMILQYYIDPDGLAEGVYERTLQYLLK